MATQNYSLRHALYMIKKKHLSVFLYYYAQNSPLTFNMKLTYYFDVITLKSNIEKNIYHGQFTQVAKQKRTQKCKKKLAVIIEMNHQGGVVRESVDEFSRSRTKTF